MYSSFILEFKESVLKIRKRKGKNYKRKRGGNLKIAGRISKIVVRIIERFISQGNWLELRSNLNILYILLRLQLHTPVLFELFWKTDTQLYQIQCLDSKNQPLFYDRFHLKE